MSTFKFYGSSDDIFAVEGDYEEELYTLRPGSGCYKLVDEENNGCLIVAHYGEFNECWSIGVLPLGEDTKIPLDWEFKYDLAGNGYSACLEVITQNKVKCKKHKNK